MADNGNGLTTTQPGLVQDHAGIISQLSHKYAILPLSVISSSKIQKRVTLAVSHLEVPEKSDAQARLVLLYARTSEVSKLITITEQCKRIIGQTQRNWFQYNQLFDSTNEQEKRKRKELIEETVLKGDMEDDRDSADDDFEVMQDRFEKAVLPPPPQRTIKSMRIFLSTVPIPELKAKPDVTLQSSDDGATRP